MEQYQIIVLAIIVIMAIVGIFLTYLTWKRKKEGISIYNSYRTLFIMGLTFLPVGIIWMIISFTSDVSFVISIPFLGIGVMYLVIGLANRDKWNKN